MGESGRRGDGAHASLPIVFVAGGRRTQPISHRGIISDYHFAPGARWIAGLGLFFFCAHFPANCVRICDCAKELRCDRACKHIVLLEGKRGDPCRTPTLFSALLRRLHCRKISGFKRTEFHKPRSREKVGLMPSKIKKIALIALNASTHHQSSPGLGTQEDNTSA